MSSSRCQTENVNGYTMYLINEPAKIAVPDGTDLQFIPMAYSKKKVGKIVTNDDGSQSIEASQAPYDFTHQMSFKSHGLHPHSISVGRGETTVDNHSDCIYITFDGETALLSIKGGHRMKQHINDCLFSNIEPTKNGNVSGINIDPYTIAILSLLANDKYALSSRQLYNIGLNGSQVRNVLVRLVQDGIIEESGETDGQCKIYRGKIERNTFVEYLNAKAGIANEEDDVEA